MTELTDKYILDRMQKARKIEFKPQFSLHDLVGKTIQEYRKIRNPRKWDLKRETPNPEYFDALIFLDRTFLVIENYGDCECQNLNYFYHNGKKTLYSDQLF